MTQFLRNLFGVSEWLGLSIGFWVTMAAVVLLVIVMIVVFWTIKPKNKIENDDKKAKRIRGKNRTSQENNVK